MIKARFEYTEDKKSLILNVTGKADANEDAKGTVIQASASMLVYTLAQIVTDMGKDEKLKKKPTITIKDDVMSVVCKPRRDVYAEILHSYFVIEVGFSLLAHNYPDDVQITPFER